MIGFSGEYVELTERTENSSHYQYTTPEETSTSDSSDWQEHNENIQRFTQDYGEALSGSMYYDVPQGDQSTVTDRSHYESTDSYSDGSNSGDSTYRSDEYRQTVVDFNITPDFSIGGVGGGGTLTETYSSDGEATNNSEEYGVTNSSSSHWSNFTISEVEQDAEGNLTLVDYFADSTSHDQTSSSDGTGSTSDSLSTSVLSGETIVTTSTWTGSETVGGETTTSSDTTVSRSAAEAVWNEAAMSDYFSEAASELQGALSDVAQFLVGGWIDYATSDLESLEVYEVPEPAVHYEGIFDWVGQNVVLPMVGEERLLAGGRFGDGPLDDLMIAGLLATEIVAYVDPTPISDTLNAGLNAADGNYGAAALSLAGALIPGGGDKGVRAGAKIGGKVADGFSDGVKAVGKRVNCHDVNPLFRAAGKAMGKCFVGDTQVVLDFAPDFGTPVHAAATPVQEGDSVIQISDNTLLIAGVSAVTLGVTGAAVLEKRRRKRETERALDEVLRTSSWLDEDDDPDSNLDRYFESMHEDSVSQFVGDDETLCGDGAALQPSYQQREVSTRTADPPTATAVQTMPSTTKRFSRIARTNPPHAKSKPRSESSARTKAPSVRAKQNWWSKPLLWLMPWLLIAAGCFGLALFNNDDGTHSAPSIPAAVDTSHLTSQHLPAKNTGKYLTCDIQDLPVAVWILADNPETDGNHGFDYSELDPSELRILRLRMEKPDGGELQIDRLEFTKWLQSQQITAGSLMPLHYEELGISGRAEVLEIQPCPTIPPRPSPQHCLVTSKFAHEASNVLDLWIDGLDAPLGVTANHPIWSEDRQDYVQAGDLRPGEGLLNADDTITRVRSISARSTAEPVFNLEVDGEHVYYVSKLGTLVHNAKNYSSRKLGDNLKADRFTRNTGDEAHHIVAGGAYTRRNRLTQTRLQESRDILKRNQIGLDDAENGVLLARGTHRSLHTNRYFKEVYHRLRRAERSGGSQGVTQALAKIRQDILANTFPH